MIVNKIVPKLSDSLKRVREYVISRRMSARRSWMVCPAWWENLSSWRARENPEGSPWFWWTITLAIECALLTIGCIRQMPAEILKLLGAFSSMHKSFFRDEINHVIPTSNDAHQINPLSIIVLNGKFNYSLYFQNPFVMLFRRPFSWPRKLTLKE